MYRIHDGCSEHFLPVAGRPVTYQDLQDILLDLKRPHNDEIIDLIANASDKFALKMHEVLKHVELEPPDTENIKLCLEIVRVAFIEFSKDIRNLKV